MFAYREVSPYARFVSLPVHVWHRHIDLHFPYPSVARAFQDGDATAILQHERGLACVYVHSSHHGDIIQIFSAPDNGERVEGQ